LRVESVELSVGEIREVIPAERHGSWSTGDDTIVAFCSRQ
jgi:hypothetical protein